MQTQVQIHVRGHVYVQVERQVRSLPQAQGRPFHCPDQARTKPLFPAGQVLVDFSRHITPKFSANEHDDYAHNLEKERIFRNVPVQDQEN